MRKINIKLNVFLNEQEKKILEEKANRARLSQSDFIRNIIIRNSEENNETITNSLVKIVDNLYMLKSQMDFLRYNDYSKFIKRQREEIKNIIIK